MHIKFDDIKYSVKIRKNLEEKESDASNRKVSSIWTINSYMY